MADLLKLVTGADLVAYAEAFNYKTNFMGDSLFPSSKTDNFLVDIEKVIEGGDLPVMAQVHALDTEARIGDRPNFKKLEAEKLLIKEKLNRTERISRLLKASSRNLTDNDLVKAIFDDAGNLISRVLTRVEVMRMELLATGKLTVKENNVETTIDYNMDAANKVDFSSWSDANHSILSDLETIRTLAQSKGKVITRALTSTKVIGYIKANKEVKAYFAGTGLVPSEKRVLQFIFDEYGIAFAVNDEVYKTSAQDSTTHRFYPENKITFFGGNGTIGKTLYAETPEETEDVGYSAKAFVTLTQWKNQDPVAVWTKASAVSLPVVADIDNIFIATLV